MFEIMRKKTINCNNLVYIEKRDINGVRSITSFDNFLI